MVTLGRIKTPPTGINTNVWKMWNTSYILLTMAFHAAIKMNVIDIWHDNTDKSYSQNMSDGSKSQRTCKKGCIIYIKCKSR